VRLIYECGLYMSFYGNSKNIPSTLERFGQLMHNIEN